jgi:HEAT repeat protein
MLQSQHIIGLVLALLLGFPVSSHGQTPDIQGRAPLSLDAAISSTKDPLAATRSYAAYSLAQLGPAGRKGVPELLVLLKEDADEEVRAEAARALGRIGRAEGVVQALRAALRHKNLHIAVNAAEALGLLGQAYEADGVGFLIHTLQRYRNESLGVPPEFVFEALVQLGPRAKEAGPLLLSWLRNRDPLLRLNVLSALKASEAESSPVISALIGLVSDNNVAAYLEPVGETCGALFGPLVTGRFETRTPVSLRDYLDSYLSVAHANRGVRQTAMRVLAQIGPKAKAAVPVLSGCLMDSRLKGEAERTLEAIQGRR